MSHAPTKVISPLTISISVVLLSTGARAESPGEDHGTTGWKRAKDALGILPETDSPYGAAGAGYLEQQIGRKFTKVEKSLLARDASGMWKTFSDDLVSFELPDDPLLTVEAFVPNENPQLEIVGGAVGTTDKSFTKVYRITFGNEAPYGLVLVTDQAWFDEGICFCGPIALKTFVPLDGNLIEMSQLPDGAVKKFQAISDSRRAILFEWTHSAITQSAYFRIGASLRLQPASGRSREDWIALSKKHRGFEAGLGWLRPGTTVAEVIRLLGEPVEQSDVGLKYIREERGEDGRGWRSTFTIPISEGHLKRLASGWSSHEELEAPRGTRAWVEDTLRSWSDQGDELPEGELPELPSPDVDLILELFREKAGTSTGSEWDFWCGVIADLARLGVKDDGAAKLVSGRCGETDLPQFQARWVLELYELPGREVFVQDRLNYLMGDSQAAAALRGECHNLFASLEAGSEAGADLIRRGAAHDSEKVRQAAVFFADKLPPEDAERVLRAALFDAGEGVRRSAILNVTRICDKDDLEWLRQALEAETDEGNREDLAKRIRRIE